MEDKLRKAIKGSVLSLGELSRRSGVATAVISRFVAGSRTVTVPVFSKLCAVLDLRLN